MQGFSHCLGECRHYQLRQQIKGEFLLRSRCWRLFLFSYLVWNQRAKSKQPNIQGYFISSQIQGQVRISRGRLTLFIGAIGLKTIEKKILGCF